MTAQTKVTTVRMPLIDLAYVGDYAHGYDLTAGEREALAALNALAPPGVVVCANGDVLASLDASEAASDVDWRELVDSIDVDGILSRHERPTLPDGIRLETRCSCGWIRQYGDDFAPAKAQGDLRQHLDAAHGG